jgi:hypothetical protein
MASSYKADGRLGIAPTGKINVSVGAVTNRPLYGTENENALSTEIGHSRSCHFLLFSPRFLTVGC